MSIQLLDRRISSVAIVDDQIEARESYEDSVIDAGLEPVLEERTLPSLEQYSRSLMERADSLLCDFKLRVRNYAVFDGAELVAACYDRGYPAVLCTRFRDAQFDEIRAYRQKIPVLLDPDALDTDTLRQGFAEVLRELSEGPGPERRPWRTQVRIIEADTALGLVYVDLPGWHSSTVVRLRSETIPLAVRRQFQPDFRCHAMVNIGAEEVHELYFSEWESE